MVRLKVDDHNENHIKSNMYYKTVLHTAGGKRYEAKTLFTTKQRKTIYKFYF